jgi:hypothetical protein
VMRDGASARADLDHGMLRDIAERVGDLHGCSRMYEKVLAQLWFLWHEFFERSSRCNL